MSLIGITIFLFFASTPIYIILLIIFILTKFFYLPEISLHILMQQIFTGITPISFVCIPMFMMAANVIISGSSSQRIVKVLRTYFGHIYGSIPIITTVASMLFGAISGSTQATVAAIGGAMRPILLKTGYSSSFSFGLIINASDIATLIPPGISFVIYGIVAQVSIGKLFLSGIGPGVLITVIFSIYCYFYSRFKNIGRYPKIGWKERIKATKESILLVGFPIIILGGIYGGILSPTEASAVSVVYALFLEGLCYRSLTVKKLLNCILNTSIVTAITFSMTGTGRALGWLMGYSQLGAKFLSPILGSEPSALKIIIVISFTYFILGMFTSPIVGYYIFTPIFAPYIIQAGLNEILVGVLIVMQSAIASATPPFGCDIFTAMVIFGRPYHEVVRESWPFILLLLLAYVIVIIFPDLALFIPSKAFGV